MRFTAPVFAMAAVVGLVAAAPVDNVAVEGHFEGFPDNADTNLARKVEAELFSDHNLLGRSSFTYSDVNWCATLSRWNFKAIASSYRIQPNVLCRLYRDNEICHYNGPRETLEVMGIGLSMPQNWNDAVLSMKCRYEVPPIGVPPPPPSADAGDNVNATKREESDATKRVCLWCDGSD